MHYTYPSNAPTSYSLHSPPTGLFCPFAHRVNLVRCIKGLQDILPLSIVRPFPKDGGGWRFPATNDEYPGATVDHLFGSEFLSEVYFRDDKEYKGKFSVPLLWDKKAGRIVSTVSEFLLVFQQGMSGYGEYIYEKDGTCYSNSRANLLV
jgi:glutathionyl-hydroquinone reductase